MERWLVENNGNDPFLEDCKSPVQPIWIPHYWLRWVVTIHLIHWLTAKPMSILGSTGIILWYTVWVSIPSAQVKACWPLQPSHGVFFWWCARWDSNPHCSVSKTVVSYQLHYLRENIIKSQHVHWCFRWLLIMVPGIDPSRADASDDATQEPSKNFLSNF